MKVQVQLVEHKPEVKMPFLWKSNSGCVYLRNVDEQDIIIGPKIADKKVGRMADPVHPSSDAWERRLRGGEFITLSNDD